MRQRQSWLACTVKDIGVRYRQPRLISGSDIPGAASRVVDRRSALDANDFAPFGNIGIDIRDDARVGVDRSQYEIGVGRRCLFARAGPLLIGMKAPYLKERAIPLEADIEHFGVGRGLQDGQKILKRLRLAQLVGIDLCKCRGRIDHAGERHQQCLDMLGNIGCRPIDEIDRNLPRELHVAHILGADDRQQQWQADQCEGQADADPERKAETRLVAGHRDLRPAAEMNSANSAKIPKPATAAHSERWPSSNCRETLVDCGVRSHG